MEELPADIGQLVTMVFTAGALGDGRIRRGKPKKRRNDNAGAGVQTRSKKGKQPPIINPSQEYYDSDEMDYYLSLTYDERKTIADIEQQILHNMQVTVPIRFKVLTSGIDDHLKMVAMKKLEMLYALDESCSEYHKTKQWIDALCRLPVGKYAPLAVDANSCAPVKRDFILQTQRRLDEAVYGHKNAKETVIRLLAQWISKPDAKGIVIGIQGPPGTGKTSLCVDGICKALDLPFSFVSLGGVSDASFLEGHSYTYEGSTYGRIAELLMKAKVSNPMLMFDELDKVSDTPRGDEIINLLVHLTDPAQNNQFCDRYFGDLKLDLSRCLMVFSYNDESRIHPILKDRMFTIRTSGYNMDDKLRIAHRHLIPAILTEHGFKEGDLVFTDEILRHIINSVDKEDGVRNLKRALMSIVGDVNLQMILSEDDRSLPIVPREKDITLILKSLMSEHASSRHCFSMYV